MPLRTQLFSIPKWNGGLNTSLDPAQIDPNQLTLADNFIYDLSEAKVKRPGIDHGFCSNTIKDDFASGDVDIGTDTITVASGIFNDDDIVQFRGTSLPGGLTQGTTYYVVSSSATTIKVSLTLGGTAVNITSAAAGTVYLNTTIVASIDYWKYDSSSKVKTQQYVMVGSNGRIYSCSTTGTVADISSTFKFSNGCVSASMVVFNNKVFICADSGGSTLYVPRIWTGTGNVALATNNGSTFPSTLRPTICGLWLGRIITNNKSNPDRLHYCATTDEDKWDGTDDSGAVDIGVNDGDPDGITAIFPPFQGDLFVAKRTKIYRIRDEASDLFPIDQISNGIGCISHNSVAAIEQDDVFFVSDRGVHSLATTSKYGGFESTFISKDIQGSFNDDFTRSRLKYSHGAYLANINCYMVAVTDSESLNLVEGSTSQLLYELPVTASMNNCIYLYNIPLKAWYRWPNISCASLMVANDLDKRRVYIGNHVARISKTLTVNNYDISTQDENRAITMQITSGLIYTDNNPYTKKAYKKFSLFYKPEGSHNIIVSIAVGNINASSSTAENSFNYSGSSSAALLGSTFTLGSSTLGSNAVGEPIIYQMVGYGKYIIVSIEQSGLNESGRIMGMSIEYETAGTRQERASSTE